MTEKERSQITSIATATYILLLTISAMSIGLGILFAAIYHLEIDVIAGGLSGILFGIGIVTTATIVYIHRNPNRLFELIEESV